MRSVVPAELYRLIFPPGPTATMTMLETVLPAVKLTLDVLGRVASVGQTVTKPDAVVFVAVTLSAMELTPAGRPGTVTVMVCPDPTFDLPAPRPLLVSRNGLGVTAVNDPRLLSTVNRRHSLEPF